jgi:diaminohydroxyphosphoribosylaminopyrimidine deaminase/5-amino-6-(5-phosphoribosylamino)uracil reductase
MEFILIYPPEEKFMQIVLALSKRGVGLTAPNPSVGCVLVKNGQIIATGVTGNSGRPHAETIALAKAGENAQGATAYVTLEPCCHHGKTPPCTDALIKAGIKKVVIATTDTFKKVSGLGVQKLQEAGIEVILGICEDEARIINQGFFSVQEKGRPYVTLKLATSFDGKIADKNGNSKWITSSDTRAYAHYLRAKNDAIMVGIGTVLADNPMLDCRLSGMQAQSPIRIILDNNLRIPLDSKLVQNAKQIPLYIIGSNVKENQALAENGVKIIKSSGVANILSLLAEKDITRLMIEGGSKISASFISEGFVDEFVWMRSAKKIGHDGIDAIAGMDIKQVTEENFTKFSQYSIGEDLITTYKSCKNL